MFRKSILTVASGLALFAASVSSLHAEPKGKDAEVTVFVSPLTFAFTHFVFLTDQLEDEAKKIGGVTIVKADAQLSAPKQIADLEAAIVQGVDGIILAPVEADALAPVVKEAIAAGITVVTVDRPVNGVPEVLANVAADNFKGAESQGEAVVKDFPKGAKVVNLQGIPGDKTANDRSGGVHKVLDAAGGKYTFVSEQTANFSRDKGLAVTENILTGLSEVPDVIVAGNDDMALGAAQAVEARGLKGKIKIYGYDGSEDALKSVKDGSLAGTVDQFPGQQGRVAIRTIVDFIREGKKPDTNNVLVAPVAITPANLEQAERVGLIN
ncbi:ABC-type sugar transport system substrate-binding protein [Pararhizobium capsulatum DSM 1112]|uniref:ABC-type sugar transport system substrate-binding protein n=1 Tax=Pararhizobium capsulatum DSM 1112 TaxID=1121113 RepID=A0ABU0C2K4_9HYPH|nr:substrate-binding domain-containing protein [Pararhizobium capsulatum]MDQ0323332.1 ABC-type sugar transport system substrate-binding protein [Pararhizobium capsulatum DSM 1112]